MSAGNVGITVTPWTPPDGYCPSSWAQASQDFINNSTFVVTQPTGNIVFGSTPPAFSSNGTLWGQTVGNTPFIGVGHGDSTPIRIWEYSTNLTAWVIPHGTPPSSSERRLWTGAEASLVTYDGGDGGAAGPASGPMWQVDHAFDALILIGPGTLPSTTVLTVGVKGGNETVMLTQNQTPPHIHTFTMISGTANGGSSNILDTGVAFTGPFPVGSTPVSQITNNTSGVVYSGTPPLQTAVTIMPPYLPTFVIQRTSRVYYKY